MAIRVPGGTLVPGLTGTAPTPGAGDRPGRASASTTLWLARVPLVHGSFRPMLSRPTARNAVRAGTILNPMTFGSVTAGAVDEVSVDEVVVDEVVVVLACRRAPWRGPAVGELLHDARTTTLRSTPSTAACRCPRSIGPSLPSRSGPGVDLEPTGLILQATR